MIEQSLSVDKKQATVKCRERDGAAILTAEGDKPTMWREPGGEWCYIEKEQEVTLAHGDQVGLDANNPEGAVFTIVQEQGY